MSPRLERCECQSRQPEHPPRLVNQTYRKCTSTQTRPFPTDRSGYSDCRAAGRGGLRGGKACPRLALLRAGGNGAGCVWTWGAWWPPLCVVPRFIRHSPIQSCCQLGMAASLCGQGSRVPEGRVQRPPQTWRPSGGDLPSSASTPARRSVAQVFLQNREQWVSLLYPLCFFGCGQQPTLDTFREMGF